MIDLRKHIRLLPTHAGISCCTSSTVLTSAEIIFSMNNVPINFSRLFLYYMAREIAHNMEPSGTSIIANLLAFNKYGCCLDRLWPIVYSRVNKKPSISCFSDAINYVPIRYSRVAPIDINSYLDKHMPVIIGMHIGELFFRLHGSIESHLYFPIDGKSNKYVYGHAMVVVGYDDRLNNGSWLVANSAGLHWGDKGYCAIPYSCAVDVGEAYAIHSVAGYTPR